jgi:pectin methylesterase-like acyl-CoA thioesterase
VSEGTYIGNLEIGKNLTLISTDGSDATSIKGNITIGDDNVTNVTIEGFTIDGKVEGPAGFDPQAIFEDNVFPEGSRIIGNKIMVPAAETVYNLRTGDEYECIQSAVSEAELGDTILVGSGTYKEDLVIAVENLTLVSVEKHAAIIETQGDFEPGLGYGGITILADGVTIDGFKIKQSVAQAIVHTHNADGVTIKNNSISGIEPSRGIDIGYASAGSNSVTVEGNEFADLYCGVYVNQGNNLVVESNVFNGMNGGAVVFDGTWGNTNNITVKDNEAKDAEYLLFFYDTIGSVVVEGNDLTNTELSNYGVYSSGLRKYFPTLQAAVGAASTGDTLLVAPGDYDEILGVQNKSLTIVGLDKENTKVKAISAYPGSSNDLVIKNLTVYGNNGSGQSYAGVYIANGNVTIDGCNIHGTDRIYHGIMTETGNTGNVIIQNCDLLGYKWPYFNPSQGSIMLEGNDFHGSGPSIDGFTNVTVTGNRNMSIGLAIGYGLLNKEHGEVLDGLSSELKAFAVMLHSENTDVVVKLSTNDTDTGAWGGYYTGLDEEGNLTITEQYLSK